MNLVARSLDLRFAEWLAEQHLYCHLVTELPSPVFEISGQLAIAVGGNYSPIELSGVTPQFDGLGARLVADPISWISLTTNGSAITGAAFFIQEGESISSGDTFVSYMGFTTDEGDTAVWVPDGRTLTIPLDKNSFLRTRV